MTDEKSVQLKQLVRVGVAILLMFTVVNAWTLYQGYAQKSCVQRVVRTIQQRAQFSTDLDNLVTQKIELDRKLTNRELDLADYNSQIAVIIKKRETAISARDKFRYPKLVDCQ